MRHGDGTMQYSDGTIFKGNWAFNEPSGEGRIVFPNEDSYEGGWAMNVFCGYGVLR